MTFYYTSLLQMREKDFWRLHRKKSPAANITINLLVNFHLRVFPEKSWGIIYIFPGSSMVLSTPGIFDRSLPESFDVNSIALFFIFISSFCLHRRCNLEKIQNTILTIITLYGIKIYIIVLHNLRGCIMIDERKREKCVHTCVCMCVCARACEYAL